MSVKISIIMPVYNTDKYLSDTLDSIIGQTYKDFELIIINDGSTDDSLRIAEKYARSDERIKIIDQPNKGVSEARNTGIDLASGEWIYFMDSDDLMDADMLRNLIDESEGFDVVISGYTRRYVGLNKPDRIISLPGSSIRTDEEMKSYLRTIVSEDNRAVFFSYVWVRLISAGIIKDNHLKFDKDIPIGEDKIFNTEVFKHTHRIRILDTAHYSHFVRGYDSAIGRFYETELDMRRAGFDSMVGLYKHYNAYEASRERLEINEGKLATRCMIKINYPTCTLDKKGKIRYIKGFLQDERRKHIIKYLSAQAGIKKKIKKCIVAAGNPTAVYYMVRKYGKNLKI